MKTKTMQDIARDAIFVQSAGNLSGIVHSFSAAMPILRAQRDCTGTRWINEHPVSILFASQIAHLTGLEGPSLTLYNKALRECELLAASDISLAAIREIDRVNNGYDKIEEAKKE